MGVRRLGDTRVFLSTVAHLLSADEAKYNRIIGMAMAVDPADADIPYMAVVESPSGRPTCCCYMPIGKQLEIVEAPDDDVAQLARFVARDEYPSAGVRVDVKRVGGPRPSSLLFAETWSHERGATVVARGPHGIYRCDRPVPPARTAPGTTRAAGYHDLDFLVPWMEGFIRETGLLMPSAQEYVRAMLDRDRLFLWTTGDGPVCMGGISRTTPHGAGIAYVYSPPEHRRRGYATMLAYALTRRMLDTGFDFCFLYTDLENPSTNGIYRSLGYRLIAEFHDFELVPRH